MMGDPRSGSAKLVPLCYPRDVGELALIKSLLEGNGIPYAVHHEHVGALYPGVSLLGGRVMVAERENSGGDPHQSPGPADQGGDRRD